MKSRDPHAAAVASEQCLDPEAHFFGGLVGKRNCKDLLGLRMAVADKVGDATGDDAGFSRSCPRQDQQGALDVENGLSLFGIEGVQELHGARKSGLTPSWMQLSIVPSERPARQLIGQRSRGPGSTDQLDGPMPT